MKTSTYQQRKKQRFRSADELVIAKNPAFTLENPLQRKLFEREYKKSAALYHDGQPDFEELLHRIQENLHQMWCYDNLVVADTMICFLHNHFRTDSIEQSVTLKL